MTNKQKIRYFFDLRKQLFLFFKLCLNDGLTLGVADDKLTKITVDVCGLFLKKKWEVSKEKYPYAFDKNGEQIGCKMEDYK